MPNIELLEKSMPVAPIRIAALEGCRELAEEVSTKIADSVLKGKYEYVLTTHTDKKHIHSVRPDRAMRKAV